MEKIPKDVVELITNKLTPKEFFNYCKSETGQEFCSRKEIWLRRIEKDFGFLNDNIKSVVLADYKVDPKRSYLDFFVKTSEAAEEITSNILKHFGERFLKHFMRSGYPEYMYEFFFDLKIINESYKIDGNNQQDLKYLVKEFLWSDNEWQDILPNIFAPAEEYGIEGFGELWSQEIGSIIEKYLRAIFHRILEEKLIYDN